MIIETTLAMTALSGAAAASKTADQALEPALAGNAVHQSQPILPCPGVEGETNPGIWPPGI